MKQAHVKFKSNPMTTYFVIFPCRSSSLCKSLLVSENGTLDTYTVLLLGANFDLVLFIDLLWEKLKRM